MKTKSTTLAIEHLVRTQTIKGKITKWAVYNHLVHFTADWAKTPEGKVLFDCLNQTEVNKEVDFDMAFVNANDIIEYFLD